MKSATKVLLRTCVLLVFIVAPAASQEFRNVADLHAGPTRAVGGEFEGRLGLRVEAGVATRLRAGLHFGIQAALDFRPQSGLDDCLLKPASPGGSGRGCVEKAPTLLTAFPELRFPLGGEAGLRVGAGAARSGKTEAWGAGVFTGLDFVRRTSGGRAVVFSIRAQTFFGVSDQRVSTLGLGVGLQRGWGGSPR